MQTAGAFVGKKKKKGSAGQNVAIFFLLYENEKEK